MPDSKRDTNGNQDAFIELKAAFSSPREAELALKPNQTTRQVKVGKVTLGGGAPGVVQSMLNLP